MARSWTHKLLNISTPKPRPSDHHTHASLTAILPRELGLASSPPTRYILFNGSIPDQVAAV